MSATTIVTGGLWVYIDGRSLLFNSDRSIVVGRSSDSDVISANRHVSRQHALIRCHQSGGWVLEDLDSTGGCYHGGHRVERLTIDVKTTVWLGSPGQGQLIELEPTAAATPEQRLYGRLRATTVARPRLTIGRAPDNDVVVDDVLVSGHHAEVRWSASARKTTVVDLNSHLGTFMNGDRVEQAVLDTGDLLAVGRHTFRMVDGSLEEYVEPKGVSLAVNGLTVRTASGQTILDNVSFHADAGSLVAIVGPTGCGKSTLLRAALGEVAGQGEVLYDDRDLLASLAELRGRVGHVPQDDILHSDLRLGHGLAYAAELRLPADTTPQEREARVHDVMAELGLSERARTRISDLSGGQRRRTNVALELLSDPAVLLLDEPTSGLDPGFEKSVMELLRRLADDGTTVVVATHDTSHLSLCDQVVALNNSGRVAFAGDPADILSHFGKTDYAAVFSELRRGHPAVMVGRVARRRRRTRRARTGTDHFVPARLQSGRRQLSTLTRRQLALVLADRRNLLFAALGVIVPAVALLLLVPGRSLDRATAPHRDGALLVASLVVAGACLGADNALREIVKEKRVHRRERAAGLSVAAYLGSKLVVLGGLSCAQSVVLVRIATLSARGPDSAVLLKIPWLELALDVSLTAVAAVALGLLVSALVSNSEKAMSLVAAVFIVQWLFSGAALTLTKKPAMEAVAYVTSSHWGYSAAGATTDLKTLSGRCDGGELLSLLGVKQPVDCGGPRADRTVAVLLDGAALVVLTGTALALTGLVLARRDKAPGVQPPRAGSRRPA